MLPDFLAIIPYSTIFILVVSAFTAIITSQINLRITNKEEREQVKAWAREVKAWTSALSKAKRAGDEKRIRKLMRKEKRIKRIQMKMASQSLRQMRSMPILMGVMILFWLPMTGTILLPVLSSIQLFPAPFAMDTVVAYIPWFDGPLPLQLFWWYIPCTFASNAIISHVLGLRMGAT